MKKRKFLRVRQKRVLAGIMCAVLLVSNDALIGFHSYAAEVSQIVETELTEESVNDQNQEGSDNQQGKEENLDGEELKPDVEMTPEDQDKPVSGEMDADSDKEPGAEDIEEDNTEEDPTQNGDDMTSADDIASGVVDESYGHIEWVIDKNGKLTVSGTGDFAPSIDKGAHRAPWDKYRMSIKTAEVNAIGMTDGSCMFMGCENMTTINLDHFDVSSVTDMKAMFKGCNSLSSIDLSGFDTKGVIDMSNMFDTCKNLKIIYSPYNVTTTCSLPVTAGDIWYLSDDTTVIELPQNLGYSVALGRNFIPIEKEEDFYIDEEINHKYKIWNGEVATKYEKGNGTLNNPYQIANGEQLAKLSEENESESYYILIHDIYLNDVSNANWINTNNLKKWNSIENFKGNFDGLNHTIYGLYGDSLFGQATGALKNINIVKSYITSGYTNGSRLYVGAVAGYASFIYGCSNAGNIYVTVNEEIPCVGGIAGYAETIQQCHNSGSVTGSTDSTGASTPWVGGIAGEAKTLDQCSNTGYVQCSGGQEAAAGGIVGHSWSIVTNSYNSGEIRAHSSFSAWGYNFCGGIVGDCRWQGTEISYCYNIGTLYGGNFYCGDIVGISGRPGIPTLHNCSYMEGYRVVGKGTSSYYGGYYEESCNQLTESAMKDAASHIGFDFDEIWYIDNQYNNGYPILQWQKIEEDIIPPVVKDIVFTDSPYSVYTDYDVLIMAKIANGSNLSESDFTWKSNDENVAKIVSTSSGQIGDMTYAFATLHGTGKTLGYGSLTLTLSDGRSGRCALICVGKKTDNKQPSYQVTSEPKEGYELLAEYGNQWEKEYNAYIKAVNKSLNKYASSDDGKREAMIADMAKKMQQEDSKSSSKHLSFEATFPSNWSKSNVYNALARYLCDNTSSKMDFGENLKEKNIVKTVLNSLSSSSAPYTYGNIEMNVSMFQFSGSKIGSIVCYDKNKPNKKYTVAVCSTRSECEAVIRDYYDQLASLENAAVYNIYTAVGQDILGEPVSKFTEKWLKQHLGKCVSQLNQTGIGNLYNSLETCNKYYQFIIKISNGDMDAAESLMGTISGLKLDDTTIEDSIVKKAAKNLNTAGEKLIKAYMQYMEGTLKEGWLQKTMRVIFSCPVGISVWNEDGEQIGYVGEDDIWYTDAISIEENGEAKIINSYTNEQLKFTISGTDYGILGCSIEEYNIGNEPTGRLNFYDIPLSQDTVFTLDLPEVLSDSLTMDSSDGSTIAADEYILTEDNGGVNIMCAIESDEENGGTVTGDGTYVRGDAAVLTATPEAGFRFIGWYQDDVLWAVSKVYEFTAREDISLKAVFRRERIDYTVTFDLQGHGSISTSYVDIAEGSKIEEEPIPIAEGYTFTGWYKEESCENKWDFEMDTVHEDITLYAGWVEDGVSDEEKYYQVDFDSLGHGIAPEAYTNIKENSTISEPVAPTAASYRFIGWFKDRECTIPWQFDVDIVTSDITLYAGWAEDNISGEERYYQVNFDTLGHGIAPEAYTNIKENSTISEPVAPTAAGYRFIGWFKDHECTIPWQFDVDIVTSDLTLYAGWTLADEFGDILPEDIPESGIIPSGLWIAAIKDHTYTGKPIKPEVHVYDSKTRLQQGRDYTITYKNNVNAKASSAAKKAPIIVVKGKGNYAGTETETFTIQQINLDAPEVVCDNLTFAYTSKVQKKIPTISYGDKKLTNNKDFIVSYPDLDRGVSEAYCDPGTYEILLTAKEGGNYTGTRSVGFTITKSTLINKATVDKLPKQPYTGYAIEPDLTVRLHNKILVKDTDYTVAYTDNKEVGKATAVLTGIGDYAGTKKVTFNIAGTSLNKADVYKIADQTYNGSEQKPDITVSLNGSKLQNEVDYKVTYTNNLNAGKATATVTGINAYTGVVKKTFRINAYDLKADAEYKIDGLQNRITCKYLKDGCTPKIELTFDDIKLTEGTDYTLSYKNHKTVTTSECRNFPTITIKGKGNFKKTISKTFAIVRKPLDDAEFPVTLRVADKGFSDKAGNYISKPVLIDTNGKKLVAGKDYDSNVIYMRENGSLLSKTSRLSVGDKVKVKVTGKGAYSGQLEALYEIKMADFSKAKVTIVSKPYTGSEIVLDQNDVTVKLNGAKLNYETDYEILPESYRNNLKKGMAEVTIIGKGKYGGMKTVKFRIISKKLEWFWRMLE